MSIMSYQHVSRVDLNLLHTLLLEERHVTRAARRCFLSQPAISRALERLRKSFDDEPLSGLARAFFYAGAKSLVVSHWEVDSEATVALMDGLFEALKANPRLSHAEALRLSMLRMIANSSTPEWAQPEFWDAVRRCW
jgi:hypothetical protein